MTEHIFDHGQKPVAQDQELACENVEWLAALWELTDARESRTANPKLLTLLRCVSRLLAHPAVEAVLRARPQHSRDRLIKAVVRDAYGEPTSPPDLRAALTRLRAERDDLLGHGPSRLIDDARRSAVRRVEVMAGRLDPAADMADLTGEYVPLRVALAPSVFLPPPQSGRHGVLLRHADGWVAHLHFGFPLEGDIEAYGINRPWILGGAWHYAIDLFLMNRWPIVAERLAGRLELAEAISSAVEPVRLGRPWIDSLRDHLSVAFKCLLARRQGVPDGIHRALARAFGLSLFPWFEEWLTERVSAGEPLDAVIRDLPDALAADQPRWSALGGTESPRTVNLALVSPAARRATFVVPDDWADEAARSAVAGWRPLRAPLLRYSEWRRARAADAPAIAFGEPERNPLVHEVLAQRRLSLDALAVAHPAIVALSATRLEETPWCIAVAVDRPETAAKLAIDLVLRQTTTYILFDGPVVIGGGPDEVDDVFGPGSPSPRIEPAAPEGSVAARAVGGGRRS
jgi:hypothetical protein